MDITLPPGTIRRAQEITLPEPNDDVPEPRRGGTFIYCPHLTAVTVKVPKKKAQIITTPCPWKTRKIRKYRRHYRRMHG